MMVLVTGVAGFVGSHLAEALLAAGARVRGVDAFIDYYPRALKERNLTGLRADSRFELIEADLATTPIDALLAGVEVICHQAAQAGVRASWGAEFDLYTRCNVLATQRLLEGARRHPLRRFVYASSSSVYGDAEVYPTHESLRPQPHSPYGVTKLAAEHLCVLYARNFGVPTVSLRYFTVYGPRQRPDMAFRRLLTAVATGRRFSLFGDGGQTRDFTFISDIVAANLAAIEQAEAGAVLNIGGGAAVSMNRVIELVAEITGQVPQIDRGPVADGDVRHTAADTARAREMLGYAPNFTLAEGLACQWEWLRADPALLAS